MWEENRVTLVVFVAHRATLCREKFFLSFFAFFPMRNLAVTLVLILAAIVAVPVMPQTTMGIPPEVMKRLSVSYDLNTLYPKDLDGVSFSGFGVGYSMDFPVSDTRPLYIGTGVDFRFIFRSKIYSQTEQYNLVNIKQRTSFIQMNIPANIGYILPAGAGVSVTPYAGVTFRVQLYGHNRNRICSCQSPDANLDEILEEMELGPADGNLFSEKDYGAARLRRLQLGWQIGARVQYRRVSFQAEYGKDIIKLHKNLGGGNLLLSVGYTL